MEKIGRFINHKKYLFIYKKNNKRKNGKELYKII